MKPLSLKTSYAVEFSRSGSILVALSRDVVAWKTKDKTQLFRSHPLRHPAHCAIHPDEREFVVKNTSGAIVVVDAKKGTLRRTLYDNKNRNDEGSNICYSTCGKYLVDGSWNGQLTVRSAVNGTIAFQEAFPGDMITHILPPLRGDRWLVVHTPKWSKEVPHPGPSYISLWEWPFTSPTALLHTPEEKIWAATVSPSGTTLCVAGGKVLTLLRLPDLAVTATAPFNYGGTFASVAWAPDSGEVASVQGDVIIFHGPRSLEPSRTYGLPYACDVAYSPDGQWLALGSWKSGVLVERTCDSQ